MLFNTSVGQRWLADRVGVDPAVLERLPSFGLSSICNILAAVKVAKQWDLGPDDVVLTVATDGAELYGSERDSYLAEHRPLGIDDADAAAIWAQHLAGVGTDHVLECDHVVRAAHRRAARWWRC